MPAIQTGLFFHSLIRRIFALPGLAKVSATISQITSESRTLFPSSYARESLSLPSIILASLLDPYWISSKEHTPLVFLYARLYGISHAEHKRHINNKWKGNVDNHSAKLTTQIMRNALNHCKCGTQFACDQAVRKYFERQSERRQGRNSAAQSISLAW